MRRLIPFLPFLLVALLLMPAPASADGIVIIEPPPGRVIGTTPLAVRDHIVNVTIDNQVATTRVDQTFVNPSNVVLEGTYVFPLPEGATISEFNMWVDGKKWEGKVLNKDEAREIYESIVRRRRDPALLEYIGRGAFQASIFPIQPGDERRVELEYTQVLTMDQGLVEYVYPLNTEKFSAEPLERVSITVDIESDVPLRAIYSPSHAVDLFRDGETRARVGYEDENVLPDRDFVLYYTVTPEDVGLNVLSYKVDGEDGYFLLLAAPPVEVDTTEVVARDVLLVLDTSGSMEGDKLVQAKAALSFVLEHLNPEDRFNIVTFSTGVRRYARGLQPASDTAAAQRWVENLTAGGSTDINRALLEALADADPMRPAILIFLTDGLPTAGVTEEDRIIANVTDAAPKSARVFTFGVGYDVNTILLDTLARELRGASDYVRPEQRIDEIVSGFYAKVSTPVLADIQIDWSEVFVEDTYPQPLPDLFAGTQLVMVGRYRDGGATDIILSGQVNDRPQSFRYSDVRFVKESGSDGSGGITTSFIPRLWATRKIGYLLNQIRLHGENREMIDEIVELAVRHGIATPYTSFLVDERADVLTREGREAIGEREFQSFQFAPAPMSGASAVQKSQDTAAMEQAERPLVLPMMAARGGSGQGGPAVQLVRAISAKTFVLRDEVWTDTTFDPAQMTTTKINFGSERYFELLTEHPEWAPYFAAGQRVIVVQADQAYEIVSEGGQAATQQQTSSTTGVTQSGSQQTGPPAGTPVPPCAAGLMLAPLALVVGLWGRRRQ
ncbi:MAG: VIT domain-containing protein [Anaerolineae bacterium]